MRSHALLAFLLLAAIPPAGAAEAVAAKVRELIRTTYGFRPSTLTDQERDQKSQAMDAFWGTVKASPGEALPVLRLALEDPAADRFFRFDGSNLLAELDASAAAKTLQISCYAQADLGDVDLRTWVATLARLGAEGFDTSAAAAKWLEDPKLGYSLPEHASAVHANEGALFLYGAMDEGFAVPALTKVVADAKHPGRDPAFWVLANLMTPEAIAALRKQPSDGLSEEAKEMLDGMFSETPHLLTPRQPPKLSRKRFLDVFHAIIDRRDWAPFRTMAEDDPDGEQDAVAVLKPEDLPLLRQVRRLRIATCNQHAIEDYDSFTGIIATMIWRPEWSKPSTQAKPRVDGGAGPDAAGPPAPPEASEMVYTLAKDETLTAVARKFNVTLSWLILRNDIQDESTVKEGLRLTVPRPAAAPKP